MRLRIGRPPRPMSLEVVVSPEEIVRVLLNAKPPKNGRYLEEKTRKIEGDFRRIDYRSLCKTIADR